MTTTSLFAAPVCVATLLLASAAALAQAEPRGFAIERLRPALDAEGIHATEWATVPEHLRWSAGLALGYVNDPLTLNESVGGRLQRVAALVKHRVSGAAVASLGLLGHLEVGLVVPFTLYQERGRRAGALVPDSPDLAAGGTGDLWLAPKVQLLRGEPYFVDVAFMPSLSLPSSTSDAYLGEDGVTLHPEMLASKDLPFLRLAANVGLRLRKETRFLNLEVNEELTYQVAAAHDLEAYTGKPIEAQAGLAGAFTLGQPLGQQNQTPLELLAGARYRITDAWTAHAAWGAGLRAGFGTPDFRVLAALRYSGDFTPPDSDADGLLDPDDACPQAPEDFDAFEDLDGCPDPDNDGDAVLDAADQCPLQPETNNAYQDEDGCPEDVPDSDGDGHVDTVDACPQEPEDLDEHEDQDGCLDADNDGDGIIDGRDGCPNEAGPTENGGCPDTDRDQDGVPDRIDNCPDVPGKPEFQGCDKQQLVRIESTKIEISERVYFDAGKETIQERSFALLNNIAEVLGAHPEIQRVSVEGHTDSQGAAEYNLDLSQRRAQAVVNYLIGKGIAAERLTAKGYGEEKPIASNRSEAGRATNRRVEFHIVPVPEAQSPAPSALPAQGAEPSVEPLTSPEPAIEPLKDPAAEPQLAPLAP